MTHVLDGQGSIEQIAIMSGIPVQIADSVAFGSAANAGHVVVCGSHGGTSAGEYAARFGYGALITSDAGGGLNEAGVAGLRDLDEAGVPAAAVSHESARIGDGRDIWESGVVSFANRRALEAGVRLGCSTPEAADAIATLLAKRVS